MQLTGPRGWGRKRRGPLNRYCSYPLSRKMVRPGFADTEWTVDSTKNLWPAGAVDTSTAVPVGKHVGPRRKRDILDWDWTGVDEKDAVRNSQFAVLSSHFYTLHIQQRQLHLIPTVTHSSFLGFGPLASDLQISYFPTCSDNTNTRARIVKRKRLLTCALQPFH